MILLCVEGRLHSFWRLDFLHARCPYGRFPKWCHLQIIHTSSHMYCLWWIWVASPNNGYWILPWATTICKKRSKKGSHLTNLMAGVLACLRLNTTTVVSKLVLSILESSDFHGNICLSSWHFPYGSIISWDRIVLVWGHLAKLFFGRFAYIWMQKHQKLTTFGICL